VALGAGPIQSGVWKQAIAVSFTESGVMMGIFI
jgi:hypothetical protein